MDKMDNKANIIKVRGIKNGHIIEYLILISESESILKVMNLIASELLSDLGIHFIAKWKIIARSVEVPVSWLPYKILYKKRLK